MIKEDAMRTNHVPSELADAPGTKGKIWQAAQSLFATYGYKAVSVRKIAAKADVNSALIGYHFGNKLKLFIQIYEAHVRPMLAERRRALAEITSGGRKPGLEEVLEAWILPWLRTTRDKSGGPIYLKLSNALAAEASEFHLQYFWREQYHITNLFLDALQQCLPHLSRETLIWRIYYTIGGISFIGTRRPTMMGLSGGKCDPDDLKECVRQLIPFAVAAFAAPEPGARVDLSRPISDSRGARGCKRKKAGSKSTERPIP
jgi:AcrR family transcriptional regulator